MTQSRRSWPLIGFSNPNVDWCCGSDLGSATSRSFLVAQPNRVRPSGIRHCIYFPEALRGSFKILWSLSRRCQPLIGFSNPNVNAEWLDAIDWGPVERTFSVLHFIFPRLFGPLLRFLELEMIVEAGAVATRLGSATWKWMPSRWSMSSADHWNTNWLLAVLNFFIFFIFKNFFSFARFIPNKWTSWT